MTDPAERIAELEAAYKRVLLELHIMRAAADAGLRPTAASDAANRVANAGEWRVTSTGKMILLDDKGSPVLDDQAKHITPAAWLKSPRNKAQLKKDAPHLYVDDSPAEQPAARPLGTATTRNPYIRGAENFTEQGWLERDNPTLAMQMAAAAGVKLKLPA
jgi:hypothetical protein